MTRRKTTAFTFSVTLSRVMMSCGGTSNASCRSDTRTIRSIGAKTRKSPGPFASGSRRPRRKITPRSYSGRILIEASRYRPKMMAKIRIPGIFRRTSAAILLCGLDNQMQPLDAGHAHARAFVDGLLGHGVPDLAVHEDLPLGAERRPGHADLADHPFLPGDDAVPPRAQSDGHEENDDRAAGDADAGGGHEPDAHLRDRAVDEEQSADDHFPH